MYQFRIADFGFRILQTLKAKHQKLNTKLESRNAQPATRITNHKSLNTVLTYLYKFRKVVDNNGFFMIYL
jgi:hypothetical protein